MDWRHFLRGRTRGDAIVEYILVLPILMMMLFGILEIGRVLDAWIVVQNAAREGARSGALASASSASTVAQQDALSYLQTSFEGREDVDKTVISPPIVSSDSVSVTAEADIHIYTPFMQVILTPSVPVRATAVMPR